MLENYVKELQERLDNGTVESTISADEIVQHAYMLTQYDKCGGVGMEELKEYAAAECLNDEILTVWMINEYLSENNYMDDYIYSFDEIDDVLSGMQPFEIIRMAHFGTISFNDDYFRFNGYGNIESVNDYTIQDEYETDVKAWMIENEKYIENTPAADVLENADIIIETCNNLIENGF